MFGIAFRALKGRFTLALLSAVGVALAVGLAVSVPVFAQAVSRAIMEEELAERADELGRSALGVRHYLLPSSQSPINAQTCIDDAPHLANIYQTSVGIPVTDVQVQVESGGLLLKAAEEGPFGAAGAFIGNASFGFITDFAEHVRVPLGDPVDTPSPEGVVNVWMAETWANEIGIQPGERLLAQPILGSTPLLVRVAGTWEPQDAQDAYWPASVEALKTFLYVYHEDYTNCVEPILGNMPVGGVSWLVRLDERHFVPERAEDYVKGLQRAQVQVMQMLPGSQNDVSPLPILQANLDRRRPLTLLLFGFTVPIIGFLLYFLALVSRMVVENQRRVTATLVSRGMSSEQVVEINLYQGLIVLLLGAPFGILLGVGAARLMGHISSFMAFAAHGRLEVSLRGINLWLVLATLVVSMVARLWPSLRESRWGMVEYTARLVRLPGASLAGRLHLELLLAIPTYYLYHQLKTQGSIALLGWKSTGDVFRDPALFLVPALFILTAALWGAQLFPLMMQLLDRTISGWCGAVGCLTLHQLGRRSRDYVNSLLLIVVSLSVGVFMASMALSLDRWMADRAAYPLGADVVARVEALPSEEEDTSGGEPLMELADPDAFLVPREALSQIPGVLGATWVGHYRASVPKGPSGSTSGIFMAIDRQSFPTAAAFRPDFAAFSLGELMNRLGAQPNGVLLSRTLMEEAHYALGDAIELEVSVDGTYERAYPVVIVGMYDYFPTVVDQKTPTVIGNLDYLITMHGGINNYAIWLCADQAAVVSGQVARGLADVAPDALEPEDVWTRMAEERDAKERIGVYGTLTLGFLASLILSGVGLLIQYQRSLHERLSRFAMLRAIGLRRRELFIQVQLEYLLVLAVGLAAGVLIGVLASRLFIPYFRVSTAEGTLPIPPLVPLLDRPRILWMTVSFGAVQFLAQIGLIWRAMRSELFQVLRMGQQE